jgi:hypothetical protein
MVWPTSLVPELSTNVCKDSHSYDLDVEREMAQTETKSFVFCIYSSIMLCSTVIYFAKHTPKPKARNATKWLRQHNLLRCGLKPHAVENPRSPTTLSSHQEHPSQYLVTQAKCTHQTHCTISLWHEVVNAATQTLTGKQSSGDSQCLFCPLCAILACAAVHTRAMPDVTSTPS